MSLRSSPRHWRHGSNLMTSQLNTWETNLDTHYLAVCLKTVSLAMLIWSTSNVLHHRRLPHPFPGHPLPPTLLPPRFPICTFTRTTLPNHLQNGHFRMSVPRASSNCSSCQWTRWRRAARRTTCESVLERQVQWEMETCKGKTLFGMWDMSSGF